ncbi:hypothetical protein [Muriicola marianensis]|uniref:Aldose 1-epimerase n=1 Tax=Muriicola marianensis TaxID=1324801 RepID=A0ABQ1R061_9FLAO|nr:hypothetical protein [Muriicola marianensis]GGD53496.1 hypothetical protein GCM10011361_20230 [Muriicola marianensis]
MGYILQNSNLKIQIDAPFECYQGSRFDWTGKISEVIYHGITLTRSEKPDSRNEDQIGKGLYNEFGIATALGFEEAEKGGWFHKIGVGLLKKDGDSYLFHKPYTIDPAHFDFLQGPDRVTVLCTSKDVNGYAYVLRKDIELQESGFAIHYHLVNTGEKEIHTSEYVHNFLGIDRDPIGPHYAVEFPFPLSPDLFEETVNPEGKAVLGQNQVSFKASPKDQFFFSPLNGNTRAEAGWTLTHRSQGIRLSESGSFQTDKVNLWGWTHVISPELFHTISLMPGQSTTWSRTYQVLSI